MKDKNEKDRAQKYLDIAGVIMVSIDTTMKITLINKKGCETLGYAEQEIIGKNWFDTFIPERIKDELKSLFAKLMAGEMIEFFENPILTKNGDERIIAWYNSILRDDSGNIIGTLSSGEDITERKYAEDKLRESEEKLRNLMESVPAGILISTPERNIIELNSTLWKIFGYNSKEDFLSVPYSTHHYNQMDREQIYELLKKGRVCDFEARFKRKDGTLFWGSLNSVAQTTTGTTQFISIFQDITERKQISEIKKINERLEQEMDEHRKLEELRLENERLMLVSKAKSEFIASISHELRTPLTSIYGFSELLKDDTIAGKLNEKQEYFVNKVLASSNHLILLINDILNLSKIEAGKMELEIEKFSVPQVIDEAVTLIKEIAVKRNITIKTDIEPFDLEADQQRFKQVLLNLLNNAVKFSKPDGGIITITAKKSGDMAQISVSDTGIGIKDEDIGRLFWTFEQLESGISRKYGGTGLGLAISKKLVELHCGTIMAESKYGEGSTFTFLLPIMARGKEIS